MNPLSLNVGVTGLDAADVELRRVIRGLSSRRDLNMELARMAVAMTQQHLINKRTEHTTADRLGARPTGFRRKSAGALQPEWDDDAAVVSIPRNTGLGRAFGPVDIVPVNGKTYLTIPGHRESYGHVAADFPDQLEFRVIHSWMTFLALVWKESAAGHAKGEVAFWLRRSVHQKQDRALLPADDEYRELGRRVCAAYVLNNLTQAA